MDLNFKQLKGTPLLPTLLWPYIAGPPSFLTFKLIYINNGDKIIIIIDAPTISKIRFKIREEIFAKLLCTRKIMTSWLNINDISVLSSGTPRNVGMIETYLNPFIMNVLSHEFLISLCSDSTATIN